MSNSKINDLIIEISSWPGIGKKTATRLVNYLLQRPIDDNKLFFSTFNQAITNFQKCEKCNTMCEVNICDICNDPKRNKQFLCLVSNPESIDLIEETKTYKGLYFVLYNDQDFRNFNKVEDRDNYIKRIRNIIKSNKSKELILAFNTDLEGEFLCQYIKQTINMDKLKITQLAIGLPFGAKLNYSDSYSIKKAIENRT